LTFLHKKRISFSIEAIVLLVSRIKRSSVVKVELVTRRLTEGIRDDKIKPQRLAGMLRLTLRKASQANPSGPAAVALVQNMFLRDVMKDRIKIVKGKAHVKASPVKADENTNGGDKRGRPAKVGVSKTAVAVAKKKRGRGKLAAA
jgi:hypothetical protein